MATLHLLPGGPAAAPRRPSPADARTRLVLVPGGGTTPAALRPTAPPARRPLAPPTRRPGVPAAGRPGRAPAPLRLTRRGRVVVRLVAGLLLAAAVTAAVLLLVRPAMAGTHSEPVEVRYHLVMPGETLLQIAAEAVPGVDARDTAARIIQLNALPGSGLAAGQRLALPVRS